MPLSRKKTSTFTKNTLGFSRISNSPSSLFIISNDQIFVSGITNYDSIFGRTFLTKIDSNGYTDNLFCNKIIDRSKFNASPTSIVYQSDGKILISGTFTNYAGTTGRNHLIRINSDNTLDTTFCTNAVDGAKFNISVSKIEIQSDGKILVGGGFSNYAGTTGRSYLIRLNSDGTLDTTFCTNAVDGTKFSSSVRSLKIQPDGKILVGGTFTNYASTSGRSYLVRLNSDGTLDTAFCTNAVDGTKFNSTVSKIEIQSDGKILVAGNFLNYGGVVGRNVLICLNQDGTLDTTFCTNAVDGNKFNFATVNKIRIQTDGKIVLGGSFTAYAGTTGRNYLIRVTPDGILDTTFCTNAVDGSKFNNIILDLDVDSYGRIWICGTFTNYAGTTGRNYLICINSDGSINSINNSFYYSKRGIHASVSTYSQVGAIQPDGKIILGSEFGSYGGVTGRNYLIRLNSDGTTDTDFCTNAVDGGKFSASVTAIYVQSDGKILVGGFFTNYAGTSGRNRLIRLNSDGTTDTDFCTNAVDGTKFSASITAIDVQSDGKILVAGNFLTYGGGTGRNYLVRLNSDGTTDTAFCTNAVDGSKFNSSLNCIAIQPDGKILAGGNFTAYASNTGRRYLVRLNSDGTTDTAFCTNAVDGSKFNGLLIKIAVNTDNSMVILGNFVNYGGTTGRNYVLGLNSDGTVNTTFCTNAVDGSKFASSAQSLYIDSNGKIIIAGQFINYAGTVGRSRFIRLNSNGTTDTDFCIKAVDNNKFANNSGTNTIPRSILENIIRNTYIILGSFIYTDLKNPMYSAMVTIKNNGDIA
jgi:uncharacterized delta-60 repeat protein